MFRKMACGEVSDEIRIAAAELVIPSEWDEGQTLNHNLADRVTPSVPVLGSKWKFRPDYYQMAAERVIELSAKRGCGFVYCFDEYSEPTDAVLRSRRHVVHSNKVFLIADANTNDASEIAKVLGQARSRVTLGVVTNTSDEPCKLDGSCLFFTDVFESEVIVVCDLSEA